MVTRLVGPALLLIPVLAAAAGPLKLRPGMTGVADLGAIDCAMFNHMYPAGPTGMEQAVLTWAEGYFYARSGRTMDELLAAQPPGARDWDFDALTGHIVAFCADRPEAPLPAAVQDLWRVFSPPTPPARDP